MPRVKRGVTTNRRHKKILKAAKGYRQRRNSVYKLAKNAVDKAGQNAYRDRRLKKRSFSRLWITRINAACRQLDISYSRFIYGLELANIQINRKMLSELAANHMEAFETLVKEVQQVLPAQGEGPDLEALKKRYGQTSAKKAAPKASDEKKEVKAKKSDEKVAAKEEKKEVKKPAAKKTEEAKVDKEEK